MFGDVTFAYQWVLYGLLIIPFLAVWYWYNEKKHSPSVTFSSLTLFEKFNTNWRERLRHTPVLFRLIALVLLIIALARPQSFTSGENIFTEGIDIVLTIDISGSMLAEDFKPNRMEAAKQISDQFIQGRTSDRIGLVIFAGESFTQCPLTIDYNVLRNLLREVKTGMIEDGTAIGNALANSVSRLKDSDTKSKVIILLTDGVSNRGEVDPMTAAEMARLYGIRVYTVGVGSRGEAPFPVSTPFGVKYQMVPADIDEPLLIKIAELTNGNYFRATDNRKLEEIFNEIDQLERTKVEVTTYRSAKELFYGWLSGGLLLLLIELTLAKTIFRKIP